MKISFILVELKDSYFQNSDPEIEFHLFLKDHKSHYLENSSLVASPKWMKFSWMVDLAWVHPHWNFQDLFFDLHGDITHETWEKKRFLINFFQYFYQCSIFCKLMRIDSNFCSNDSLCAALPVHIFKIRPASNTA